MPRVVDHDKRRRDLSALAYEIITQNGIDAATYRSLAERAGCTTGMIVHYFPKRDDILLGALSHAEGITRKVMDDCLARHDGIDALRELLYAVIPADRKIGDQWRLWISFWGRATANEVVREKQREAYTEATARWSDFIRKAQAAGDLSPDLNVRIEAQSVMALLDGLGVQSMFGKGALNRKQQRQLIDNYINGLMHRNIHQGE